MSPKKKRSIPKGTGRRYTSTRPERPAAPARRTPPKPGYAEQALRRRISRFAYGARFQEDFESAFKAYLGPEAVQESDGKKNLVIENEDEFPGFQEWFIFDCRLRSGERIIDLFAQEEGPGLAPAQRKMLDEWLPANRLRLLETIAVEPGVGETVQDLLSGEILHLNDISFSYAGSRWVLLLARPLVTEGRWHFTGSGLMLTPMEKPRILDFAQAAWREYQEAHPQASLLDFYRDTSLELRNVALEIIEERSKPRPLFTGEGHPAVLANAEFALKGDRRAVEKALEKAEEYQFVGEQEDGEFAGSAHYLWLLRGQSSVPEIQEDERWAPRGLMLSGSWTAGPGETDYRTLGDLFVAWDAITLQCMSRQRLEAGKELLYQILGTRIQHRGDQFQDLRQQWEDAGDEFEESDRAGSAGLALQDWEEADEDLLEQEQVAAELNERFTRRWLDSTMKGDRTPRQMAETPEGREELREIMKTLEFMEDQALKEGESPPMRLDIIRKELGL